MRHHRCLFNHAVTAMHADELHLAMLRASRFLDCRANVGVTAGRNDLGIRMTANGTRVRDLACLGTSGGGLRRNIIMTNGFHHIGRVPFATDGAFVLDIALLGAIRRDPDRVSILVTVAVVGADQYKGMISADRHTLGVTHPTVGGIAHLFLDLGRQNHSAIGQDHLGNKSLAVVVQESHGILAGAGLDHGSCHDIHRGSGRDGVGNTVSVNVPANQHL